MIKKYLYYRKGVIISAAICTVIFAVTFVLYRLPLRAVVYPAALCLAFLIPIAAIDFRKSALMYKNLLEISKLSAELIDNLPEPLTQEGEACRVIIYALKDEIKELEDFDAKKHRETIDYYTVWVHQIKTPIASMRLTLQNEDSALSRRLSTELSRIERYVEMVLAYLRLDSPSSDYVFKEYRLDGIIRQAVKKSAPEFIERKLRLDYSGTDEKVVTDEKWLIFVLEQILSNALKYTREGGIKIYTKDSRLYIEDTGIGISSEDLPRIFEKGFTGLNGRYDKKASGLGLYLCRSVCRNLGIEISAESVINEGTKVTLDFNRYDLKEE